MPNTNHPVNVLIVGAGPVGLALACHLRRLGLSIRLIEKRAGPSEHSKAIGLQYRVSEILARLGIVDRFIARGGSPTTVNIHAGHQRLLRLRFLAPSGVSGRGAFQPQAIVLPQADTEALLIDHLNELGGSVEWETEFLGYTQEAERVVATVRRSDVDDTIESQWLVSCEGAHSVVRKQARISFDGKTYPLAFFMADVHMEGRLPHEENHVWLHQDGSLAALPLPAPGVWRLFIEVTDQGGVPTTTLTMDTLRGLMAARAPDMPATIIGEPLWLSDFRINCRLVNRMQDGRVFLAGDAAHIHSPTGGQGITTGMQDAVNLAWKLARVSAGAPQALLATYDEERRPHAAEVLRETDRTTNILFAPTPVLRVARNVLVLPLLRRQWVQRRLFGKLAQLHVHYRNSSLSQEVRDPWKRRRLRAGDRAPDVTFGTRAGTHITLFALMGSMRPVVIFHAATSSWFGERLRRLDIDAYALRAEAEPRPDADVTNLTDATGDFAGLYGLTRDFLCLIRPDGHLGFVGTPASLPEFRGYLERLCDPADVQRVFQGPP